MSATVSPGKFTWPAFYDMPPLYTVQPVLNTRQKQLQMWGELVLDYSRFHKKYEFDINELATNAKTSFFINSKINRKLSLEGIRLVFEELVSQGNGEWQDKDKNRITIYWRSPQEWGNLIYNWVADMGKLNTVLTVFEIQQGEDSEGQEFHGLETKVLLKALKALEKQNKAQVFTGTSE
eukprot:CAMPEP_0168562398 /NCGR_PEP_ID=MMETSP0413-20121227/12100_1 /TAXON_ID=136452 /ORGANISM="Filamoeba nolandi, Strain NC-AS-23-1" /LENGTH=178 /DNA_ID=CAMNT_0008593819 /DNA_START=13 /DNA_END=546 /DNA_ORIENTATION=+